MKVTDSSWDLNFYSLLALKKFIDLMTYPGAERPAATFIRLPDTIMYYAPTHM